MRALSFSHCTLYFSYFAQVSLLGIVCSSLTIFRYQPRSVGCIALPRDIDTFLGNTKDEVGLSSFILHLLKREEYATLYCILIHLLLEVL